MNIPNLLTALRFVLIPVFVYVYLWEKNIALSVVILAVSGITDFLDGYIARRFNLITKWGAAFDPIADKLTQIVVSLCIALSGLKLMWFIFGFLVFKEISMVLGGINLYKKGDVVVPANWYGKIATFIFYLLFFVMILFGDNLSEPAKSVMIFLALALSFFALIRYAILFFRMRKKLFNKRLAKTKIFC